MPLPVTDLSSNAEENIAHAAKILGRSRDRLKVFNAIYTGKKRIKSVIEIAKSTKLPEMRILQEGKKLSANHIIIPTKIEGRTAYEKIDFLHNHKKRILSLASSPDKLRAFPTKRNIRSKFANRGNINVAVTIHQGRQNAHRISIDDIDSFAKVRKLGKDCGYTKMPEQTFKKGIAKILGEKGTFKDWGGENRDLASTRVKIASKRYATAFAFKGPGKSGKLTPGKMGKNGDQIQRLARCTAEVFLVQYWAEIDDTVLEQLEKFAQLKSFLEKRIIQFGIIDGIDSSRLIKAYPKAFGK